MRDARLLREQGGVTLAELTVTLALFALIMIGVVSTWTKAQEAYFTGSEVAEVQENVRTAIDFMVREFRATGRDATVCAFDYGVTAGSALDCTNSGAGNKVSLCTTKLNSNTPPNGTFYSSVGGCHNVFAIPQSSAFTPVGSAVSYAVPTDQAIAIRADLNDNGTIARSGANPPDPPGEEVVYSYSTTACPTGVPACITRDDGSGAQAMVAVDIAAAPSGTCTHEGFCLTYYPRPGYANTAGTVSCASTATICTTPLTLPMSQNDADNIGRIHIQVKALQQTVGNTVSRTLQTDVYLRNRKS